MIETRFGDCLEIVKEISDESIDMVLTDPPYGISYATSWRSQPHRFANEIENDKDLTALEGVTPHLYRVLKPDSVCFVFCSWKKTDEVCSILSGGGSS